jgi:hypothetical protein
MNSLIQSILGESATPGEDRQEVAIGNMIKLLAHEIVKMPGTSKNIDLVLKAQSIYDLADKLIELHATKSPDVSRN